MFSFHDVEGDLDHPVEVAFTDSGLDLSERPGTDRAVLAESLDRLRAECGVPIARMTQVHGAAVATVRDADSVPEADALVTDVPGLALVTRVADCVPVLLADGEAGVLAAVHAGREGVRVDVVGAAVSRMRELGAGRIRGWVGPHVCGRCFEVPAQMQADVVAVAPAAESTTDWGTPALDLGTAVSAQLDEAGVRHLVVTGCTREDSALFSHRRDGDRAGRFAGVVWTRP